jgi:LemA protein
MVVLVVAIVVVVVGVPFAIFNRLVHLRNMVRESWRDIDTELQRRYDLIPNLVSTVKGYAAHEREVFDSVTTLRTGRWPSTALPMRRRRASRH